MAKNTAPVVSWYEGKNDKANEVKATINYGTVDAGSTSNSKTFFVWNNREGKEVKSKMTDVIFTTKDRQGGTGDTLGNIVEAVRDNWFQVRVDSLEEVDFAPVGKGGVGTDNPSGSRPVGTKGKTTNPKAAGASVWTKNQGLGLETYVQPTVPNDYIYQVIEAGTTDGSEPSWSKVDGAEVSDGTVKYRTIQIVKVPQTQELLGEMHDTLADGSNADLAGGNWAKLSVQVEIPVTASAGKNLLMQRIGYKYV